MIEPDDQESASIEQPSDGQSTQSENPFLASQEARTLRKKMESALEAKKDLIPFSEKLLEIDMRLSSETIFPNEAVVELSIELSKRKLPITGKLLAHLGIKDFVLTHDDFDRQPIIDFIIKRSNELVSIEDSHMPNELGLVINVEEEIGDELRGILVEDSAKGYCLHAPDHTLYPLDAAALAPLEEQGGAAAFLNKNIIVQVVIGDILLLKARVPDEQGN